MRIITERSLILSVAERWHNHYQRNKQWHDKKAIAIAGKLNALDLSTATTEDVKNAIGNDSWTMTMCNECGEFVGDVIMLGDEPDYDSNTAYLCFPCFKKACELIEGYNKK